MPRRLRRGTHGSYFQINSLDLVIDMRRWLAVSFSKQYSFILKHR